MKLALVAVSFVIVLTVCWVGLMEAPAFPHLSGSLVPAGTMPGDQATVSSGGLAAPIRASLWVSLATSSSVLFSTNPGHLRGLSKGQLPAGVYRTDPYKMLVLVPGVVDQRMMVPERSGLEMPTFKPDLEFVPWTNR